MEVDATARGRALQAGFRSLGTMYGKTANDIIAIVGQPSSMGSVAGEQLMMWQAIGYHIELLFDADGRFVKVTQQYAQNSPSPQPAQTKPVSSTSLSPSRWHRWVKIIAEKYRTWRGSDSPRGIANNPWIALMERPVATQATSQSQRTPYAGASADQLQKQRIEEEAKRKSESLLVKHSDLIDRFLELAERRVSAVDEYGDEQWDALPDEIEKCLAKIAKRELATFKYRWPAQTLRKTWSGLPESVQDQVRRLVSPYRDEYVNLSASLERKFRAHHSTCKSSATGSPDVGTLAGVSFENYVATLLKKAGFSVVGTRITGDQGADLIAKKDGKTVAIQVKGWAGSVGNSAVQEIVAAIKFYNANEGWVVTNSTFTTAARLLAQVNNIRLIDGHDLKKFLSV